MPQVQPFAVKFSEGISALKSKLPEISLAYDDLAGPVHAKVFTVAGATKIDIVRDLHGALTSAIENGTTITDFRKAFDKTVAENGWTYNGTRGWRSQLIFDTNMRSAHMAGRWQQLWAGKDRRPFLQYRTAGDAKVRPQHRQWNGVIRPITDVFWSQFYPPNGWGCRCTVRAYSQAEIDRKGLEVATEPFPVKTRTVTKKGEPVDVVPVGVDPGWDHNVGVSWVAPEIALGRKLASLPPSLRDAMVAKTISPAFQRVLSDRFKAFRTAIESADTPAAAAQIVGFLDGPTTAALQAQLPAGQIGSTAVAVPAQNLSALDWSDKMLDELPEQVRNYQAVLWDVEAEALMVLPLEGRARPKSRRPFISIKPAKTGPAKGAMEVTSAGMASRLDLLTDVAAGGLKLLIGSLE